MTDEQRAREFLETFPHANHVEWECAGGREVVAGYLAFLIAKVREEERERCVVALCQFCAAGRSLDQHGRHPAQTTAHSFPCGAAALRTVPAKEPGGEKGEGERDAGQAAIVRIADAQRGAVDALESRALAAESRVAVLTEERDRWARIAIERCSCVSDSLQFCDLCVEAHAALAPVKP